MALQNQTYLVVVFMELIMFIMGGCIRHLPPVQDDNVLEGWLLDGQGAGC